MNFNNDDVGVLLCLFCSSSCGWEFEESGQIWWKIAVDFGWQASIFDKWIPRQDQISINKMSPTRPFSVRFPRQNRSHKKTYVENASMCPPQRTEVGHVHKRNDGCILVVAHAGSHSGWSDCNTRDSGANNDHLITEDREIAHNGCHDHTLLDKLPSIVITHAR